MSDTLTDSRIVYFYEAVRCGTIRAAADWLDVAPSAVSRQIGLLEKELDATLVERHARGVTPTDAGRCVIEYFREQLAHRDDLISRLQELRGLKTGQVSLVLGEGFVSDLLAGPMQQFCRQFPGIRVNLDVGSTNDVIRKISNDEGEIGLVYNPPAEPKLVSRASKRQPMMAIVGPDFPRRSHKVLTVQQLATYPMAATHPSYGTRQMMEAVEYAERVRLAPIITTNSFAILKEFVKSGLGISVMPAFAVAAELQAKELFAIEIAHPILENAEAHMVTRVGRKLSVAANKMLQMMTGQMRAFR
ncbi:bacterial regulatory helix-turn-helix, lysR family protein [Burkholderia ambifaria AMMD]|jgi:DNA-binding transcriptional LysR family regulator|uniref:Transcriptional regulator, LysR family n=1 Tax=Burkholderia ambifaria (strain ATCC BAA-244 / DSM 16087 / CCUG 44356 / LMG 19182 / AMMD) TaxID=339670 RepID=Q0B380_BURCM|nr:LysR family transcriptional regulator [Burkholderia ambifaria]ABI91393.1 transcriptional regulator, LysR family [Burkholderia ambifaria AMMD]AJY25985.1 bacterial regulatory helix-turn-helix, lysR family protein [Burkholderia ambifaria AMMD]MBR7932218.1 LysR family transcriptional regulator [Burkholderia ambifaria]PEH69812.1 LysR family transcriptional regulator [Burkholderia ambifaria]QQC09038.1 LysR family transcriptional regulator [Burkholderia ambifaria]